SKSGSKASRLRNTGSEESVGVAFFGHPRRGSGGYRCAEALAIVGTILPHSARRGPCKGVISPAAPNVAQDARNRGPQILDMKIQMHGRPKASAQKRTPCASSGTSIRISLPII